MVTCVVGGQYGSEGKGHVCGALARESEWDWTVRVGGPNAGHCVVGRGEGGEERKYALRQLPVGLVTNPRVGGVVGAGSEIDLGVLRDEIELLESEGIKVKERLLVDEEATVLEEDYARAEREIGTGTTGKGIGAARAARALRRARRVADVKGDWEWGTRAETQEVLRRTVRQGGGVLIEGTQGYALGSHAGGYPWCTSGNCRAVDMQAAAGLGGAAEVWVVLRTYPIRIAGSSGPLRRETTWEKEGLEPEMTTVTKKVRRVGLWDEALARRGVEANWNGRPPRVALMMADYWWKDLKGQNGAIHWGNLKDEIQGRVMRLEEALGAEIAMLGTGEGTELWIR